ncbi:hypothetical protein N7G274_002608 [Stereocaulon virgatum]|uniref:Uncharacterized protein n=1 Tax=Stereocaulon virgatum TaxID=373712 RepID=A0ABR4AGB0_9LECA
MKQYLTIYEKVLLLLYYCLHLASRLLPIRKHAFPRTVQSSEQPQAYTRLLDSLRGQTVEIRDVENIFSGWPVAISPHLERLRGLANEKLEESVDTISIALPRDG